MALIAFYKAEATINFVIESGIRDQLWVYVLSPLVVRGKAGRDAGSGVPGGDSRRPSLSAPVTLTWPEQLSQGASILPHLMEWVGREAGRAGNKEGRDGRTGEGRKGWREGDGDGLSGNRCIF